MGSLAGAILSEFTSTSTSSGAASTLPLIELKLGTRVVSAHLEKQKGSRPVWKVAAAPSRGGGDAAMPLGEFDALVVTDSLVAKPGEVAGKGQLFTKGRKGVVQVPGAQLPSAASTESTLHALQWHPTYASLLPPETHLLLIRSMRQSLTCLA
jgi:hypothetical protein